MHPACFGLAANDALTNGGDLLFGPLKLLNSGAFPDVALYLGNYKLPAHAAILAIQSEYFKRSLKVKFLESQSREFRINEGSPHAHWRVVEFIYRGKYSEDIDPLGPPDDDELVGSVWVCPGRLPLSEFSPRLRSTASMGSSIEQQRPRTLVVNAQVE
ncbi:hypothetical protein B0J13DRAFT_675208 [Dactylonectria estremocensis]|uniref:BTB domain-containing protein n=1 Tax=Dactylonectria estremocensis TaxID=1079267 RepID=A0A9P9EVV2_9HYPO|nr:hypothetical protein B0J13DRAFT_675208 [Dactylonectria estremocensis]